VVIDLCDDDSDDVAPPPAAKTKQLAAEVNQVID
jgi:hypothetical protein